jgi:hypothetical protein
MGVVAILSRGGGFAVVISPPASLRIQMPAATSLVFNVELAMDIPRRYASRITMGIPPLPFCQIVAFDSRMSRREKGRKRDEPFVAPSFPPDIKG